MNESLISIEIGVDAAKSAGARTLSSAIHQRLRDEIIRGRYAPDEKLRIAPLAKRFQVSLSSVREALLRLVADGLVIATEQRGFKVSPLAAGDMSDVTRIRIELECLALQRSIARGGPEWELRLRGAWSDLDAKRALDRSDETWVAAHARFHAALISACELDWLSRFIVTLFEQSERYRAFVPNDFGRRDVHGEHLRILEATLARDVETATEELRNHLRISEERFIGYLKFISDKTPKKA